MTKLFWIAIAGTFGTLARYGLSGLVQRYSDTFFPIGTAMVNIVGCLLFGLIWGWAENRISIDATMRAAIFIGFFGAFTTFSSFAYETSVLIQENQWWSTLANIGLQNIFGLIGMLAGLAIGRLLP